MEYTTEINYFQVYKVIVKTKKEQKSIIDSTL